MNLYEISSEYKKLFEELNESGNFDIETIKNTLSPLQHSAEEKAKNIVAYINNIEGDIDTLTNHKHIIEERIKSHKRKYESLKNYLKDNMISCNIKKISCPFFDAYIKNSTPALKIEFESGIPSEYLITETKVSIDKERLKRDIKNGTEIEGVYLQETKSLTIKCK